MGKQKGKNLTKNDKAHTKEASPKPKEKEPPQAPPKEGMCLAGYVFPIEG